MTTLLIPNGHVIRATGTWGPPLLAHGERMLRQILAGVGDPTCERLFRMNITLCLHRACTEAEAAGLPCDWRGDGRGVPLPT